MKKLAVFAVLSAIIAWGTGAWAYETFSTPKHVYIAVANDAGAKYDSDYANYGDGSQLASPPIPLYTGGGPDTYLIKFDGGGLNEQHITTDPGNSAGQAITLSAADNSYSGTFYLSNTGGRGYSDDAILMVASNKPLPANFSITIKSSGYTWPPSDAGVLPAWPGSYTYVTEAVNETFTASDFIYQLGQYKLGTSAWSLPFYYGDTSPAHYVMFVDLGVGLLKPAANGLPADLINKGDAKVEFTINNLYSDISFGLYGWALKSNQGYGINWTNNTSSSTGNGYAVLYAGVTQPPVTPANVTPPDGETDVALTAQLTGQSFSDPDGDTHASSSWEIGTDSNFAAGSTVFTSANDTKNLTSMTVTPGVLKQNTRYYWRLSYMDSRGASSTWSAITSFTTKAVQMNSSGTTVDGLTVKNASGTEITQLSDITPAVGNISPHLLADLGSSATVNSGTGVDSTQTSVAIVKEKGDSNTKDVLAIATPAGTNIETVTTTVPTDPAFSSQPPASYTFPHGVVSFRITGVNPGSSLPITLYTPTDLPANAVWYKYSSALGWLKSDSTGTYDANGALISANTTFSVNNGKGILTIKDDDVIDLSREVIAGKAVVLDPGTPGVPVDNATTTPAPTTAEPIGSGGGGGGGGCFIATAAFGTYFDPYVMILRKFRDTFLLTNSFGRSFVEWYYRVSPSIADTIRTSESLKVGVRTALMPLVGFSALCLKVGFLPAVLLMALLLVILTLVVATLLRLSQAGLRDRRR